MKLYRLGIKLERLVSTVVADLAQGCYALSQRGVQVFLGEISVPRAAAATSCCCPLRHLYSLNDLLQRISHRRSATFA